ncbi:MAG: molybdenum cofactor guanylyltransferase [Actinomycetota bacterium]
MATTSDRDDPTPAEPWPHLAAWPQPVVGAILCGGRSSRFGSDKALAPFGSSTVGGRIVSAMRDAGIDPVVAIGGQAGDQLGVPTVPDRRPGDGPLGGLATALLWASTGWVLIAPCDLPLLAAEHVAMLLDGGAPDHRPMADADPGDSGGPGNPGEPGSDLGPVVATVGGKPHLSLSIWPASDGRRLLRLLDGGERRFRRALDGRAWRGVELPEVALTDADTPAELERLEKGTE